ncbi:MAG: glycosyltransferase family 2 protein [bacterium]|nr:glycosyltransferase family 2 protein [bacterium]
MSKKKVQKTPSTVPVSVVIAAHNEEQNIEKRIENLLSQDYPRDMMEILVVSDGSSDRTAEIAQTREKDGVTLCAFATRRGKASALNQALTVAKGEIVVFADARQTFKADAIRQLVANFSDPKVGAVTGELFLTPGIDDDINKSMGLYWNYEKWIRRRESEIDSVIGVTGAIYAIRRHLFQPIPAETMLDDVLIPMRVVLQGYRVVWDGEARAYDSLVLKHENELKRKVRTLMGNFQLLTFLPEALSPNKNRLLWSYLSHKFFRLLVPYALMALFILNLFLSGGAYHFTLLCQSLFYLCALAGYFLSRKEINLRYVTLPYTFVLLNYAAVAGLIHFIRGNSNVWVKNPST